MATAREPAATLVVLETLSETKTRALHVVYVAKADQMEERAERAESLRVAFAAKTANPVTVVAHVTKAA